MMEARLIVATVAQHWQFSPEADQEAIPVQLVRLLPKNGIRMKLKAAQIVKVNPCAS